MSEIVMGFSVIEDIKKSKGRASAIANIPTSALIISVQERIQAKLPPYSETWDLLDEALYRLKKQSNSGT